MSFISESEEILGISDASKAFGPGWFLFTLNVPASSDGQLLALFDPGAP
jgi:hypothetical protein